MLIGIITIFTFVFLIAGLPVVFVLGLSAAAIFLVGGTSLSVVITTAFTGMEQFVFLAIPFFILAGQIMNKTGLTDQLLDFSREVVGRLPGGLAMVNIVTSMFFAGISGAGTADAAAVGSILIPAMEKEGYRREYSSAVTVAASTIGPIIPPSITMVLLGATNDISVAALFAAGLLPGVTIGLSLMVVAYYYARKEKHKRYAEPFKISLFLRTTLKSLPALFMPIIILGGIFSGIFTPTEASATAVLYALIVAVLTRKLNIHILLEIITDAAKTSAIILLIIGMANTLSFALSLNLIPQMLTDGLLKIATNPFLYLLLTNIILLVAGSLMETAPIIVIITPILLAGAMKFGINPLHFAFIMSMNLCIGLATPPFGLCLFVTSRVANISVGKIIKSLIPFILVEIVVLFLLTYLPQITLFFPKLFGFVD